MDFYRKYRNEIYPADFVVLNGTKHPVPKYYDKLLERDDPALLKAVKDQRKKNAEEKRQNYTEESLMSKEKLGHLRQREYERRKT